MATNIPFPIRTETSCLLKWNWSTIFLNTGQVSVCHRNKRIKIPKDNFDSFHNLPYYVDHRRSMLNGEWPNSPDHIGCKYCKNIEDAGGRSDRQYMTETQVDQTPDEVVDDPTAVVVTPAVLEIFLSNTCNLACTYCRVGNSSKLEAESKKYSNQANFNDFYFGKLKENLPKSELKEYKDLCLNWISKNGSKLRRFHLLGGEPMYTEEFSDFINVWDEYPNTNLILNVVSNVNLKHNLWKTQIDKVINLVRNKKIKDFELTASLDCWGPEQEYIRTGFDCALAEKNILYYLSLPEVTYLNINSTHNALSLLTYHELLEKKVEWEEKTNKSIRLFSQAVGSKHVDIGTLAGNFYVQAVKNILKSHPRKTWDDQQALKATNGILKTIINSDPDPEKIQHFLNVYNELDRRRNTNWKEVFPEFAAEIEKYKDDMVY